MKDRASEFEGYNLYYEFELDKVDQGTEIRTSIEGDLDF